MLNYKQFLKQNINYIQIVNLGGNMKNKKTNR